MDLIIANSFKSSAYIRHFAKRNLLEISFTYTLSMLQCQLKILIYCFLCEINDLALNEYPMTLALALVDFIECLAKIRVNDV